MSEESKEINVHLLQLIITLQAGTMQHLGKIASPVSGEVETNLELAKHSIDLLEMLEKKTSGNLTPDEMKFLEHVLFELRMNYVDELKKDTDEQVSAKSEDKDSPSSENVTGKPTTEE